MADSDRAAKLRRIAETLRRLPSICKAETSELRRLDPELHLSGKAGHLLGQAIDAGAFQGEQYSLLHEHGAVDPDTAIRMVKDHGEVGVVGVRALEWHAAVQILCPELGGLENGYALACGPVADLLDAEAAAVDANDQPDAPTEPARKPKPKRSTEPGEARVKLVAALAQHHKYADGGCLNTEPIGCAALARLAGVSAGSASAFFRREFRGHALYRVRCGDAARLAAALRLLNGDYAPHILYGGTPPAEGSRAE